MVIHPTSKAHVTHVLVASERAVADSVDHGSCVLICQDRQAASYGYTRHGTASGLVNAQLARHILEGRRDIRKAADGVALGARLVVVRRSFHFFFNCAPNLSGLFGRLFHTPTSTRPSSFRKMYSTMKTEA